MIISSPQNYTSPLGAEPWEKRRAGIYSIDENKPLRKSHENPAVQQVYKEYLGEPLGHKSHDLIHTHYTPRSRYNELLENKNK